MTQGIEDLELSDLFFNLPKDNYDNLKTDAAIEEIEIALHKDAVEFCQHYPRLTQDVTPEDMKEDFLNRL